MSKTKPKKRKDTVKLPSRTIEECISRIDDATIRKFTSKALRQAPKYFCTITSSSSGRHHPIDEHGEGGLVLHTIRVFNVAEILIASFESSDKKIHPDVIKSASLLHDLYRYGVLDVAEATTNKEHPGLVAEVLKMMQEDFEGKKAIITGVERHMGKWGKVLPSTFDDWLVHFADTVAAKYYPTNGKLK